MSAPDGFTLADAVGTLGALALCAAYFMVSRGALDPEGGRYHLINLGGAALLLFSLWFRPNPGAILIEVIWSAIALMALVRIMLRRR